MTRALMYVYYYVLFIMSRQGIYWEWECRECIRGFIIHCFEENDDKRIIAAITVSFQTLKNVQLSDKQIFKFLLLEIMHCARNLQIIH